MNAVFAGFASQRQPVYLSGMPDLSDLERRVVTLKAERVEDDAARLQAKLDIVEHVLADVTRPAQERINWLLNYLNQ